MSVLYFCYSSLGNSGKSGKLLNILSLIFLVEKKAPCFYSPGGSNQVYNFSVSPSCESWSGWSQGEALKVYIKFCLTCSVLILWYEWVRLYGSVGVRKHSVAHTHAGSPSFHKTDAVPFKWLVKPAVLLFTYQLCYKALKFCRLFHSSHVGKENLL